MCGHYAREKYSRTLKELIKYFTPIIFLLNCVTNKLFTVGAGQRCITAQSDLFMDVGISTDSHISSSDKLSVVQRPAEICFLLPKRKFLNSFSPVYTCYTYQQPFILLQICIFYLNRGRLSTRAAISVVCALTYLITCQPRWLLYTHASPHNTHARTADLGVWSIDPKQRNHKPQDNVNAIISEHRSGCHRPLCCNCSVDMTFSAFRHILSTNACLSLIR